MKAMFIDENFLLHSEWARRLYHDHAADLPIYDYHSHLSPADIAADRRYDNLTQIWLDGDHYKWRAMRTAGVAEALITGKTNDYDRFVAFANIVPQCIGNPIYHWTHMELRRPFGIDDVLLGPETAGAVWQRSSELLAAPEFSARGILRQFDVRVVATTDDPIDTLEHHAAVAADPKSGIRMLPTWRPDWLLKPDRAEFAGYIERLGASAGIEIGSYAQLLAALEARLDHFAAHGCVSADHGLDDLAFAADDGAAERSFAARLGGKHLSPDETVTLASTLLVWLGRRYAERDWVMQLHIGAQRDNNSRMHARLGPNTGFDSIGDMHYARPLAQLLDTLDRDDALPRTILYGLNPRDNEMLATMIGNFQRDVPGKIQFGAAWWFNDQKDGILRHLTAVSQMSLLSRFVGMLTDSRSIVSFSRHEYFRRVLCDMIGGWVEAGEVPADAALLGGIVEAVCCNNTLAYFKLDR